MKTRIFRNLTIALFCVALSSCISVKSTFEEDYTVKLKIKPEQQAMLDNSGQKLILVGSSKGLINIAASTQLSSIATSTGATEWTSGANRLGDAKRVPETVEILTDDGIILLISETPGTALRRARYKLAAIDFATQKQLWSREEINPQVGNFSYTGFYLPRNSSYVINTPDGLQSFSVKTGQILWNKADLSTRLNIRGLSIRLSQDRNEFIYLEEMDRFLLETRSKLGLFNPYTGEFEWEIPNSIGSITTADLFMDDKVAVFYGSVGETVSETLASLAGSNVGMRTGARAIRAYEQGMRVNPIAMLDLKKGIVIWENTFYTNGSIKLEMLEDKLMLTGLVTYAFDLKTGEKIWQNVSAERLNREGIYSVLSEFAGINLTAELRGKQDGIITGNSIFVLYPEVFDNARQRHDVSVRRYEIETGELVWKSEPSRLVVRDFFFEAGTVFIITDGRFSYASKLIALDPYTGEQLYEIDIRDPWSNAIFTNNTIVNLNSSNRLFVYNIRNGQEMDVNFLSNRVIDILDLSDRLLVVYSSGRNHIMALHDRNNFNLLAQMEVPFYTRNFHYFNNQFFIVADSEQLKGLLHIDFDKFEMKNYLRVYTKRSKRVKGKSGNIILDSYRILVDNDANFIYFVHKGKLTRYLIKS